MDIGVVGVDIHSVLRLVELEYKQEDVTALVMRLVKLNAMDHH